MYYVVQSEMLDGGVIESQVVGRLRAQSRAADLPKPRLVFLEPVRIAFSRAARRTRAAYRRMWPEGRISVVPFVSRGGTSSPGEALALYLARERLSSAPIVFHCRGGNATWSAHVARCRLRRGRVVYDLRGSDAYETLHRRGYSWMEGVSADAARAYERALAAERRAASAADFVLTVSRGLQQYATDVLDVPSDRVLVTPSCVDDLTFAESRRRTVREQWGVEGDAPVFLYAGRLGRERLPDHMFRVFARVLRVRPDARLVLMLYRNDLENVDAALEHASVRPSSVTRVSCTRDEAVAQLCGADVGFFFCEPALRFRYCFPIKLPEYLAAGLSVVVNSAAAEVPELVRERGLGWIMDEELDVTSLDRHVGELVQQLAANRSELRERALRCCSELYLWRNHFAAVRQAYGHDCAAPPSAAVREAL